MAEGRCPGSTFINLSPPLDAGPSSMWSIQASVGALWPSVSPAVVTPHLPLGRPRAVRSPSRTAGNVYRDHFSASPLCSLQDKWASGLCLTTPRDKPSLPHKAAPSWLGS